MGKDLQDLVEYLSNISQEAENYQDNELAIKYAYKYGMLNGAIKEAIIELDRLIIAHQLNSKAPEMLEMLEMLTIMMAGQESWYETRLQIKQLIKKATTL